MFDLIIKAGPVMYALLLCSFVGLYVVIQKGLYLSSTKFNTAHFLSVLKRDLNAEGLDQTLSKLEGSNRFHAQLAAVAIRYANAPLEELKGRIGDVTNSEYQKMEHNLGLISTLITAGPLLGLLGTVWGLMHIFEAVSMGTGDTTKLFAGISEALINTAAGLLIAIPLLFAHQFFQQKIDTRIADLDTFVDAVILLAEKEGGR